MPSTYTANTGIEKPATGEQSGTWGETVNTNSDILDRALNGVGSIALSGTTHTLSTLSGELSDGMFRVLVFGGSPSGTNTVTIAPSTAQKLYFVRNDSGESVVLSQGSGSNVTVESGSSSIVFADGAGAGASVERIFSTRLPDMGVTAIASELNILDGATVTTAEVNILDGVTATTAELNYLDISTLGTSEASKAVTADANGVTTFDGGVVEDETSITSSGNAITVNCRDGNVFSHTLTENTTFTFSNAPASGRAFGFTLKIVQDASNSGFTVTWPASVEWANSLAPSLTASANAVDILVFYTHDGGTTWYGFVAGQAMG